MSFKAFSFARRAVLDIFSQATTEQLDAIPENYNNNIRWNVGHLLVVADWALHHTDRYEHEIPKHYGSFFQPGTSPKNWSGDVPSQKELSNLLREQHDAMKELTEKHDLFEPIARPLELKGTTFATIDELIGFLTYHEGLHYQTLKLLMRLTK